MSAKNLQESQEPSKLRRQHNQDLIRRMRNGESLTSFDSQASWFPPRPIISKDPDAIAKLYGKKVQPITSEEDSGETKEKEQVIKLVR